MIKKVLIFCFITVLISSAHSQVLTPIDAESNIGFSIKNFGLITKGTLKGLQGKIDFNPQKIASSYFNVTLDANTINTNNSGRDKHLKKADFFDVANHSSITFASTKIIATNIVNNFTVEGTLTMKGISKRTIFNFTITPQATGYLFIGELKLNRRDFKVGGSSLVMSDNLTVTMNVVAR